MINIKIFDIIIWCVLTSTIVLAYEPKPTAVSCPTGCDCDTLYYDKESTCSRNGQSFKLILQNGRKGGNLIVNCASGDPYEILSEFNFTNLVYTRYNKCPLPFSESFSGIYSGLYRLEFNTTESVSITREHFKGLRNLQKLDLRSTLTIDLADDTFADLPFLRSLIIFSKEINEKIFDNPSSVTDLHVGGLMSEFNMEPLQKWTELVTFTLSESKIQHFSKKMVSNVPTISQLSLRFNEITLFDSDAFESLTKIKEIEIVGNKIVNMPQRLIIKSRRFDKFVMECHKDASLNTLPDEFLSNIPSMSYAAIKNCNLKSVPENLFKNSTKIQILHLEKNLLTDLPEYFLANQTELYFINLSANRFNESSDIFFKNLLTKPSWGAGEINSYVKPRFYFLSNGFQRLTRERISLLSEFGGYFDFGENSISDLSGFDGIVKGEKFSFINVEMNPINCDCETVNAYKSYAELTQDRYQTTINNTICADPLSLNGYAVINVNC